MKALILIGGLGTRLRPLTCTTPKPMLPIINRPFLTYQIDLIKKYGIKEIIFCLAYLPSSFRKYFGNGEKFGVKIRYVVEKVALGTGGGVKNAHKFVDEPVIIFNGDVLTDINLGKLIAFHRQKKAKATISLVKVKDPTIYGLIKTDKKGKIKQFLEKPTWAEVTCNTINAGIYVFEPEVFDYIPRGVNYSLERGLFPLLLDKKEPFYGYVASDYWLDIGTNEKYLQANRDVLSGKVNCRIPYRSVKGKMLLGKGCKISSGLKVVGKVFIGDKVKIGKDVRINGRVSIGNNVSIAAGALLSDCVVLDDTRIGEGVKLEKCIVGNNCVIEPYSFLREGIAIGDGSIIKEYSRL
ncbi:NDP-sugar synthase [bacterium]|nr:NDP-sugar synthase [bacterium]